MKIETKKIVVSPKIASENLTVSAIKNIKIKLLLTQKIRKKESSEHSSTDIFKKRLRGL